MLFYHMTAKDFIRTHATVKRTLRRRIAPTGIRTGHLGSPLWHPVCTGERARIIQDGARRRNRWVLANPGPDVLLAVCSMFQALGCAIVEGGEMTLEIYKKRDMKRVLLQAGWASSKEILEEYRAASDGRGILHP